ncbi:hypothetical protein CMO89_00910 [Candidatus Woesearchaeota archaeon]|nr:hypothetical protein [Candidatus Woesearchaeota archaeon]|tara:strand:- start:6239 stop:8086 length:1848 start_codon:yes stop_codon:yes gene_type:complete
MAKNSLNGTNAQRTVWPYIGQFDTFGQIDESLRYVNGIRLLSTKTEDMEDLCELGRHLLVLAYKNARYKQVGGKRILRKKEDIDDILNERVSDLNLILYDEKTKKSNTRKVRIGNLIIQEYLNNASEEEKEDMGLRERGGLIRMIRGLERKFHMTYLTTYDSSKITRLKDIKEGIDDESIQGTLDDIIAENKRELEEQKEEDKIDQKLSVGQLMNTYFNTIKGKIDGILLSTELYGESEHGKEGENKKPEDKNKYNFLKGLGNDLVKVLAETLPEIATQAYRGSGEPSKKLHEMLYGFGAAFEQIPSYLEVAKYEVAMNDLNKGITNILTALKGMDVDKAIDTLARLNTTVQEDPGKLNGRPLLRFFLKFFLSKTKYSRGYHKYDEDTPRYRELAVEKKEEYRKEATTDSFRNNYRKFINHEQLMLKHKSLRNKLELLSKETITENKENGGDDLEGWVNIAEGEFADIFHKNHYVMERVRGDAQFRKEITHYAGKIYNSICGNINGIADERELRHSLREIRYQLELRKTGVHREDTEDFKNILAGIAYYSTKHNVLEMTSQSLFDFLLEKTDKHNALSVEERDQAEKYRERLRIYEEGPTKPEVTNVTEGLANTG